MAHCGSIIFLPHDSLIKANTCEEDENDDGHVASDANVDGGDNLSSCRDRPLSQVLLIMVLFSPAHFVAF